MGCPPPRPPPTAGALAAPPNPEPRSTPAPVHAHHKSPAPCPPDDHLCRGPARQRRCPAPAHGYRKCSDAAPRRAGQWAAGLLSPALHASADRTACLLAPLPAPLVVLDGTRSPPADAHRHRADNLLSRQADREDHARPRSPYAPAWLCHASARGWGRRPDDPEAAGPSVARDHHAGPPSPPPVSRDAPQPVRPPALRGHGPASTGVTPGRRTPPPAHPTPPRARPAPYRGQSPISSASLARPPAGPLVGHPRLSRACGTAKPAVPRRVAATPHTVLPGGASGTRLMPVVTATAPRARRCPRGHGARTAKPRCCLCPLATGCVRGHTTSLLSSGPPQGPGGRCGATPRARHACRVDPATAAGRSAAPGSSTPGTSPWGRLAMATGSWRLGPVPPPGSVGASPLPAASCRCGPCAPSGAGRAAPH